MGCGPRLACVLASRKSEHAVRDPRGPAKAMDFRRMNRQSRRCLFARRNAPHGAPRKPLRRDRGEELGRGTRGAGEEVVAVEHLVGGDRFDLDGRRAEVEDREAILSARSAAKSDDETRRLGHHRRDVTTVVVLAAAAARHLLEVTDQLIDPAHASRNTHFSCLAAGVVGCGKNTRA